MLMPRKDFACVDQDNPGSGVSALPIIITQCDAVISLVDKTYYTRAWCCVEAKMISQLTQGWNTNPHQWYEHLPVVTNTAGKGDEGSVEWTLNKAREDLNPNMKDKKLTYEHDRAKVMFLERQCGLLRQARYSWNRPRY